MTCKIIFNKCLHFKFDLIIFSVEFLMSKESNVTLDDVNVPKSTLDEIRKHLIISPFTSGGQLIDSFKRIFQYLSSYLNKLIMIVKIRFSFFIQRMLYWNYVHFFKQWFFVQTVKIENQSKLLRTRCMPITLPQLLQKKCILIQSYYAKMLLINSL